MELSINQLIDSLTSESDSDKRYLYAKQLYVIIKYSPDIYSSFKSILLNLYKVENNIQVATWLLKSINIIKTNDYFGHDPLSNYTVMLSDFERSNIIKYLNILTSTEHFSDDQMVRTFDEKYIIDSLIGSGGMGQIYRVRNKLDNTISVVKFINSEYITSVSIKTRFEREYSILKNIQHPNIISVFEYGIKEGCPYYIMEYLDGKSLKDIYSKEQLKFQTALPWIIQVCDALSYIHQKGVIHRDIKPANILLSNNKEKTTVKLADFGLVKLSNEPGLTKSSDTMGTDIYTSPEQWINPTLVDERSDIYSLIASFISLLTSNDLSQVSIVNSVDNVAGLNEDIRYIFKQCLNKDPGNRIQTADILGNLLEHIYNTHYSIL